MSRKYILASVNSLARYARLAWRRLVVNWVRYKAWRKTAPPNVLFGMNGATLIEVLVAIGISTVMLPALATGLAASREGRTQESERLQASALLRETDEAVRSVREKGWTDIATNGTYYPTITGSTWSLTSGTQAVGTFTRQVVISDVQRNSSGAIVASGGTADPSTKKVVTTVSWSSPLNSSISSEMYFTRFSANAVMTDTTQAEFDAGTKTNVASTNTAGGEVQLSGGVSGGGWSSPTLAGTYDGPSTLDGSDVWSDGTYAYVANSTALLIVNVTSPASPTLVGTYTLGTAIEGVYVVGNYAYLATASNTQEFIVVNVTNKASPTLAASLNLGDAQNAHSVFVVSNYAYVGKANSTTSNIREFYVINVTTPTSPSLSGQLDIGSRVNGVFVNGNYAYLATDSTSSEFRIVNVTTKTSPSIAATFNLTPATQGFDIFAVGTTVYLVTNAVASGPEFFIINAANPASPSLVGTFEVGDATTGVTVSGTTAFLSTVIANQELKAVNITTPSAPTLLGNGAVADKGNDLFYFNNTIYMATQHNSRELAIFTGGAPSGFQTSGTYESASMDAGASVAFNYLTFTITEPASTNIQFQIATNTNNSTWNYVGPDGTAGTYFTVADGIPLNAVSGRYLRFRASFSGPGTSTPVLNDATVNYSP